MCTHMNTHTYLLGQEDCHATEISDSLKSIVHPGQGYLLDFPSTILTGSNAQKIQR